MEHLIGVWQAWYLGSDNRGHRVWGADPYIWRRMMDPKGSCRFMDGNLVGLTRCWEWEPELVLRCGGQSRNASICLQVEGV